MRNKYSYEFHSQNEVNERFVLTFSVQATTRSHFIDNLQVYQQHGDVFCEIKRSTHPILLPGRTHSFDVKSIVNYLSFHIEIFIKAAGCEIFIVEKVITTIHHVENLQPCN